MKRSDLAVLAVLVIACLGALLWMRSRQSVQASAENYAVLTVGEEVAAVWPLADHHADEVLDLSEYGFPGKAQFHDGAVRVIEVDCPDKVCESMGYVKDEFQSVVFFHDTAATEIYTPEEAANMGLLD